MHQLHHNDEYILNLLFLLLQIDFEQTLLNEALSNSTIWQKRILRGYYKRHPGASGRQGATSYRSKYKHD